MDTSTDILVEKMCDNKEGHPLSFLIKKEANNPYYLKTDHDSDEEFMLIRSIN